MEIGVKVSQLNRIWYKLLKIKYGNVYRIQKIEESIIGSQSTSKPIACFEATSTSVGKPENYSQDPEGQIELELWYYRKRSCNLSQTSQSNCN